MRRGIVAKVVNIDDPDKLGRIKVSSEMLGTDEYPAWLRPQFPLAGEGWGIFYVPRVDDVVEIEVADSPQPSGVYYASLFSLSRPVPNILKEDYPNKMGFVSPEGHMVYFDKEKIVIADKGGNTMQFDGQKIIFQIVQKLILEGEAGTEPAILGNAFSTLYNAHTHLAPGGTTGPPAVLMGPAHVSQKVFVK